LERRCEATYTSPPPRSSRPRAIREIIDQLLPLLRSEAERQAERHGALHGPIQRMQRRWSRALDEIEQLEQEAGA
jgi:hypothetical protein